MANYYYCYLYYYYNLYSVPFIFMLNCYVLSVVNNFCTFLSCQCISYLLLFVVLGSFGRCGRTLAWTFSVLMSLLIAAPASTASSMSTHSLVSDLVTPASTASSMPTHSLLSD